MHTLTRTFIVSLESADIETLMAGQPVGDLLPRWLRRILLGPQVSGEGLLLSWLMVRGGYGMGTEVYVLAFVVVVVVVHLGESCSSW